MRSGCATRGDGRRGRTAAIVGLALSVLLGACATRHGPAVNEAAVRDYAAQGYAAAEKSSVATSTHEWLIAGSNVQLVLAMPSRGATVPLVIYVPGMGEAASAGERWRNAWASAGYAVLSIQPLAEDVLAWRSELARDGDFKTLGRQRYAGAVMSQRVRLLAAVIADAQRRAHAAEAPWRSIDWSRVAIAGFDLGAYTAMAVAGEHVRDASDAAGRLNVAAVIALSPYAIATPGALDDGRYKDVQAPVLSVTGDADGDVIGLVEHAAWREIPFNHMAGAGKYLLSLQGLPHADFSGTPTPAAEAHESKRAQGSAPQASNGGTGQQRSRGHKQRSSDDTAGPQADRSSGEDEDLPRLSPTALQMRLVAAQDVSTAFLDAYLKNEPAARAWLANGASRWLGESGELLHR